MKKIAALLAILFWTGILILISFTRESQNRDDTATNIDLREGERLYVWNENKKAFAETSLTGSRAKADMLYFHRFSPIDGIYYRSEHSRPLTSERKNGTNLVTFWTGLFVCNIRTGLEKYVLRVGDTDLKPKGRGAFLIDNRNGQTKIFSFDAFIETNLTDWTTHAPLARFILFPSLAFQHDPKNTPDLKGADMLRVSIVDSLRYIDLKTDADSKTLFPSGTAPKDEIFLKTVEKDITDRMNAFVSLYDSVLKGGNKMGISTPLFDASWPLLINGSKKEVLLKNALVENILWFLNNPSNASYATEISNTVSAMKEMNPKVYSDAISLLKQYYYTASFSCFADKTNAYGSVTKDPPFLSFIEKIVINRPESENGREHYNASLSNLFAAYYFLSLNPDELNASFERILEEMLDNKALAKDEFLPFVFFVTQYLSSGPALVPNEDTMLIVLHLFRITNDYYAGSRSDSTKLATVTANIFYNYTKIFAKMHSALLTAFVDTTPDGLLLKKQYADMQGRGLNSDFVEAFTKVIKTAKEDVEAKKTVFYSKHLQAGSTNAVDSFTLLQTTLASFDTLISMFTNYPKYLNDSHLNDTNRSAKGILVEKETVMSTEALETYLKKFKGLDISSLRVTNNFQKDGFYEVQATILNNTFRFKLWEQNHILADISYTDPSGTKHAFPNITIPLDQKEERLKDLSSSSSDPVLQYKYDFGNFFETTFLEGETVMVPAPEPTTRNPSSSTPPSATPEIQLFVQKELLDKDFKNIADFLPIEFQNIQASINGGNYVIKLDGLNKSFNGQMRSYATEIVSDYLFNRHSFSRIVLKVKQEGGAKSYEFNGTPVQVLPARISVLSFADSLKDLGFYIDTIKASYSGQQSIVVDLIGKKVLLDKVPFVVKFKTQ